MRAIAELKDALDLRVLVGETHDIERSGKIHCPFHDDRHPSCHIYRDGFKCFACGAYGDHIDWLREVHGLTMKGALARLRDLAGASPPPRRPRRPRIHDPSNSAVGAQAEGRYRRLLARTHRLPAALAGRGLDLADARTLGLAAAGDDALIALRGPDGRLLALKRRFSRPGPGGGRYAYTTSGHGSPAWCSPGATEAESLLIVEGELNGMVAWLALREAGARIAVVAPAGAYGVPYRELMAGRDVFVDADNDAAGEIARERWQRLARSGGARSVRALEPLAGDACEIAAACGRPALAASLLERMFPEGVRAPVRREVTRDPAADQHLVSGVRG